ncbi:ribosome silencing factor [Litorihabitans aurantiacus]|uniref:Ribosomal silencing factor RsfS n=1 Tax=Litorihabitans aurantiacus TaxID=1930061 RepID=A0AA37UQU8_9MICO|nr:ribosome silencing factor [Litorihabitans aurantiacus]GMA30878.1 ribosomal silencing factor RsfS [Litorihabitans aurantiacus]
MPATPTAVELTIAAAIAAADKKAEEIIALDVSERFVLTDAFLVTSGSSERQVSGIVDGIEEALHARGVKAVRKEGVAQGRWVLLDYGDIIVHVQHSEDREFYALERLWRDCPVIELPAEVRESGRADQGL